MTLVELSKQPTYAYNLKRKLNAQWSTVQATLCRLQRDGYVSSALEGRRRIYRLTAKGQRAAVVCRLQLLVAAGKLRVVG